MFVTEPFLKWIFVCVFSLDNQSSNQETKQIFLIYILSFNNKFDKALLNQQILLSFWSNLAKLYMKVTKSAIWGECSIHWDWSVCWAKFRLVHQYIYLYSRTFGHWIGQTHHNSAQLRLISLFPSRLRLAAKCPINHRASRLWNFVSQHAQL